jgi:hypothetical protein
LPWATFLIFASRVRRKTVLFTPHFLSLPMIIARSDLPRPFHALALYFVRLSPDLAVAQPPFAIAGFDLKQHWHRKYHHDARNRWLRQQVAELFNDESDEWAADWKRRMKCGAMCHPMLDIRISSRCIAPSRSET